MAAPALSRGRGGAAAPSERGGNHGQGWPVAREPVLRVPRGAGTEASQEGAVRRDQEGGRRDARDAGRQDGRCRDSGGERLLRPHASASGLRPSTARATWWAGRGAGARPCRASGTMSGGPYGQGPDDVGEGLPRGHRRPRRVGHREARPTEVAQGSGNAPDGGLTAAATGPSRQCRCRDGPLWGVTKASGYAGGTDGAAPFIT